MDSTTYDKTISGTVDIMAERSHGVIDGDPFAIIIFIYMAFILIFFLASNSSVNPIQGNTTAVSNLSTGYTNLRWFLALIAPLAPYMIIKGWSERSDKEGED